MMISVSKPPPMYISPPVVRCPPYNGRPGVRVTARRYDWRSRRRGRVVRQRPAKPRTAVRVRSAPLAWSCESGMGEPVSAGSLSARTTTCVELAAALGKAGLQKWVLEQVAGNGFIPGVRTPDQVADRTNPCKGAVPRKHSHFFTRSGAFGSLDWRGQPVEDGTYRLGSNGTAVTIFKEFPKVTFKYRIVGQDGHVHPADSEGLLLVQVRMGHIGRVSRQVLAAHPLSRLRRQGSAVLLRHRSCESPPAFSLTQRSSSLHGTSTSRP
jgi:hypothetical protein